MGIIKAGAKLIARIANDSIANHQIQHSLNDNRSTGCLF